MNKGMSILTVIGVFLVAIIGFFMLSYNSMVEKSEKVDAKLSDIETQLQRRSDLIPNLVNSVKGIMQHEQEAIDKVTDARTKLVNAKSITEKSEANDNLSNALNNFLAIAENYPDLKANTNFTNLMDEQSGTENRIATARKDYNDAVKEYNAYIKKMPTTLLAKMFGFKEKDYFKSTEEANAVPKVDFK